MRLYLSLPLFLSLSLVFLCRLCSFSSVVVFQHINDGVVETPLPPSFFCLTENGSTDDESGDGQSTKSKDDVDSEVTFDEDSDKEMDTIEIEEEDWIEYIKRSTVDALDKMERAKIRCWNRTHTKMKWKLALRIATSPSERW